MYVTKVELLDHMHKMHSVKRWTCQHCNSSSNATSLFVFESEDKWKAHMVQTHTEAFQSQLLPRYSKLAERIMVPDIVCPLCQSPEENAFSDMDHITECLHRFALLALPSGPDHSHSAISSKSNSNGAVKLEGSSVNSREALMMDENAEVSFFDNDQTEVMDEEKRLMLQIPSAKLKSSALVGVPTVVSRARFETWITTVSGESPREVDPKPKTDDSPFALRFTDSDFNPLSLVDGTDELVESLLRASIISAIDERPYIPEHDIQNLLTRTAVVEAFGFVDLHSNLDGQKLIGYILQEAKKVFGICLLCNLTGKNLANGMFMFMQIGFNDSSLPITDEVIVPFFGSSGSRSRQPWRTITIRSFMREQWRFLAPVFSSSPYILELLPNHVLPFVTMSTDGVPEGRFGQLYHVYIHYSHFNSQTIKVSCVYCTRIARNTHRLQVSSGEHIGVAFKVMGRISSDNSAVIQMERDWQRNVTGRQEIQSLHHPNIAQFIAAFTRGNDRYMMYEWANGGDLRQFWRTTKPPLLTAQLVQDVILQLRGLADALMNLHSFRGGSYRHGDIKPENVLRFMGQKEKESLTDIGVLKLSGLGLARHHSTATQLRQARTTTRYNTRRYEPPESATTFNQGRSRRYDIWSMGCIMLEFLVWTLYGHDGLVSFENRLAGGLGESGTFYTIDNDSMGKKAKLHPDVVSTMEFIAQDLKCGRETALKDLLDVIRSKLLVIELNSPHIPYSVLQSSETPVTPRIVLGDSPSKLGTYRANAEDLVAALEAIIAKGRESYMYWLPGQRQHELELSFPEARRETRKNTDSLPVPTRLWSLSSPVVTTDDTVAETSQDRDASGIEPEEDLRDALFSSLVKTSQGTGEFLPASVLESLVTETRVRRILTVLFSTWSSDGIAQMAKSICGSGNSSPSEESYTRRNPPRTYRKIFAILVMIDKAADIVHFIEEELSDLDLPLSRAAPTNGSNRIDLRRRGTPEEELRCLSGWSQKAIRGFDQWQWSMLSPFFRMSDSSRRVRHYILNDKAVLPFVQEEKGEQSVNSETVGGFGSVFKVNIHPSHHSLGNNEKV
jgi:serine/threonine protein kinase